MSHRKNKFKKVLKNPLDHDIEYFHKYIFPKDGDKKEFTKFITTCIVEDVLEIDNIFHIKNGIILKYHGIYHTIFSAMHGKIMVIKMPTRMYKSDEEMLNKLSDISKNANSKLSEFINLLDMRFLF